MVLILFAVCVLLYYIYRSMVKNHDYWKKRNVPYLKPEILFGNYREYIMMKKFEPQLTREICQKFPDEPYIGVFYGTEPALVIQDLNIVQSVLKNDFNFITGREISDYIQKETFTNHLLFQHGDTWKVLRQNLTPLFTPAKIKQMFPHIKDFTIKFEKYLEAETTLDENLNVRSMLGKYTMDCIISCEFGLNANCMKTNQSDNPFVIAGEQIFDTSIVRGLKMACRSMWPALFYGLGFQMFDKKITTFFQGLFKEVSNSRLKSGVNRNDFVNLISEWKKNSHITGSFKTVTGDKKQVDIEVNDELLVAHCAGFFAASFETTAGTLGFFLYELAKNKNVQNKLIKEIDSHLRKHNGSIDFECVNELPYMEACIEETLRLYPILGILPREVTDDYTLPTGLHLNKGTRIHIPVFHIQRHPEYFPEPELFRPERFYGEERKNIKQYSFLAFGEGPRICMGIRFAKMLMHPALLAIFKKYRVELSENMPLNLEFHATAFVTHPTTDICLKFKRRDS